MYSAALAHVHDHGFGGYARRAAQELATSRDGCALRHASAGERIDLPETHHVRVYTRQQMTDALRAAGFRSVLRRHIGQRRLIAGDCFGIACKPPLRRCQAA